MVLLGVSWSPVADAVPDLELLVDVVEAPGWHLEHALQRHPRAVLHNLDMDVSLADPGYAAHGFAERATALIARAGTPWLSLHLGFASERVQFDHTAGHMAPASDPLERDALFERIVGNVRAAQAQLDLPVLLENLDYCPEGAYEHVCDPAFISAVLDATGAELLLDLAHLRVSADWLGQPVEDMLAALPLERVRELHLSSPRPLSTSDPRLDDVHAELDDTDVDLLRLTLQRADPRLVVLEYRRDAERLQEQLGVVGALIGRRFRGRSC